MSLPDLEPFASSPSRVRSRSDLLRGEPRSESPNISTQNRFGRRSRIIRNFELGGDAVGEVLNLDFE